MTDRTIVSAILKNAELYPNKMAVTMGTEPNVQSLTYHDLSQKIRQAAQFLSENDVSMGHLVILSASQSSAFIIGYFATHLLGATAVPVDTQLTLSQLQYIADQCHVKIALLTNHIPIKNISKVLPLDSLLNTKGGGLTETELPKLSDNADVLFTSGTTGFPKGVILTHENILESAKNINNFIQNTSNDVELIPSPLSHSFGLARLRCNFLAGASIALANGFLLPGKIYRQLEETRATGLSFVPAGAAVLFKFGEEKLAAFKHQLKYIEMGSALMPMEHKKRLMDLLPNTRICMHYGLTEASRTCFIEFHQDKDYLDSVGKTTLGVNLKIQDNFGKRCPVKESGEIMVSGKSVAKKYLSSDIPMEDDWFKTGDYGYQNNQGYIYLTGRKKDLINVGGRKASPLEIENIINLLPSIEDSACIGIPDPKGISGEVIKVFLVLKNEGNNYVSKVTDVDLVSYLREKLEPYKIPSEFEWVENLPKTSSGKIQRNILRENLQKREEC